jgi:hypothetical protein
MKSSRTAFVRLQADKPAGGYILLSVQQLCLLWWLYRARHLQLLDLRVWYAAHEMVARRCQIAPDHVPEYTPHELHGLVGGRGGDRLRAALRRLDHLGLLTFTPHTLTFATSLTALRHLDDMSGFTAMLASIPNPHRRVPMPRRTVRLIAGGLRPAVIATILGTCLRCLYYHPRHAKPVASGGWVTCSWIAEVFHVHLRNVKAARTHLTTLGWLLPCPTPQHVQNRWGRYTQVSLTWERAHTDTAALAAVRDTAPAAATPEGPTVDVAAPEGPPPQLPPGSLPPAQHTRLRRTRKDWCL